MAKKKSLRLEVFEMPETQARAIRRHEVRETYKVMHEKDEMYSRGKFGATQSPFSAFYAGIDPRRKWEVSAAGMVSEDQNEMSNLSRTPVHKEYPAAGYYTTPYLDQMVEAPNIVREEDGSFIRRPKGRK